jgi:hypothetical protein
MPQRARIKPHSTLFSVLFAALAASCQTPAPNTPVGDQHPQIAGVWRGNSVCEVANSPCHNEVNVYRISEIAGRPGWFSVKGTKIVDGKEIVMGTGDWKYDQESHALTTEGPGGRFRLTISGNRIEGTLTLQDGTVFRRIFLQREN